jgi:hypothetical protein
MRRKKGAAIRRSPWRPVGGSIDFTVYRPNIEAA